METLTSMQPERFRRSADRPAPKRGGDATVPPRRRPRRPRKDLPVPRTVVRRPCDPGPGRVRKPVCPTAHRVHEAALFDELE